MMLKEMINGIHSAWKSLDKRSKRVLELKYVLEKGDSEIAEELEIGVNSVRMAISRARNNLKEQLNSINDGAL